MPRFYFDVYRLGCWSVDDDGMEIATAAEAAQRGARELLELAIDLGRAKRPVLFPIEMTIRVRERGVLQANEFSLTVKHAIN